MTDKPQTLADDKLREAIGRAWCHEENVAKEMDVDLAEAVLGEIRAVLADAAATTTGWVIANGADNRWRCVWEWESNAEWTDDITQALKFATRDDAERFSKEDEDAWLIYQVGIPPATTPVVAPAQAGDVRQAVRVKPLVWPEFREGGTCGRPHEFQYFVTMGHDGYFLTHFDGERFVTLSDAQAHCNAHYQTAALEPDPTPALSWRAMQTAAAEHVRSMKCYKQISECHIRGRSPADYADAILALPGPTDEQLLADAMKLPQLQAMATDMREVRLAVTALEGKDKLDRELITAISARIDAALAKICGAA